MRTGEGPGTERGAAYRGYARLGRWKHQASLWKGLNLHGEPIGAEEICQVVSMGLSRGDGHPGGGEGVQEQNGVILVCRRQQEGGEWKLGLRLVGLGGQGQRERFPESSGGRLQDGDGGSEASSGDV